MGIHLEKDHQEGSTPTCRKKDIEKKANLTELSQDTQKKKF